MTITWHSLFSAKLYRIFLALFFLATLFLMFNRPSQIQGVELINDKVAHAVTFFILTLLFSRGLPNYYGFKAIIGLALFGFLIEVIQNFLPWRSFSVADWLADVAGIVLYHILHMIRSRIIRVSRKINHV